MTIRLKIHTYSSYLFCLSFHIHLQPCMHTFELKQFIRIIVTMMLDSTKLVNLYLCALYCQSISFMFNGTGYSLSVVFGLYRRQFPRRSMINWSTSTARSCSWCRQSTSKSHTHTVLVQHTYYTHTMSHSHSASPALLLHIYHVTLTQWKSSTLSTCTHIPCHTHTVLVQHIKHTHTMSHSHSACPAY